MKTDVFRFLHFCDEEKSCGLKTHKVGEGRGQREAQLGNQTELIIYPKIKRIQKVQAPNPNSGDFMFGIEASRCVSSSGGGVPPQTQIQPSAPNLKSTNSAPAAIKIQIDLYLHLTVKYHLHDFQIFLCDSKVFICINI